MTGRLNSDPSNPEKVGLAARLGPNLAYLALGQGTSWLIRPIAVLLISRQLGPAALGKLVLAMSIWKVAGLAIDFGLERLLPIEIAQHPERAEKVAARAIRIVAITSVAALALQTGLFAIISTEDGTSALYSVIGLVAVATRMGFVYTSALRGLERTAGVARSQGVGAITELLVTVLVLALSDQLAVVALGLLVGAVVQSCVVAFEFRRAVASPADVDRPAAPEAPGLTTLASRAAPLMIFGLLVVGYREIDVLVMWRLVDAEVLGWYGAADRLYGTAQFVTTIAAAALYPVFAQMHATQDSRLLELLRNSFTWMFTISIAVGIGTWHTGAQIVEVLFGESYAPGGDVLSLFGIALIPAYLTVLLGTYAVAIGQHIKWACLQAGAIVGTLVLDVLLVPIADDRYGNGALGGAWSYIAIETAIVTIGIALVVPNLITKEVAKRIALSFVAGAVMLLALTLVSSWPLVPEIAVGMLVFVGVARLVGVISIADVRSMVGART